MTATVSQFMETVNLPMTCGTRSKNENLASSSACMFCAFFIAIGDPELVFTYPRPVNPKDKGEILLHWQKFSPLQLPHVTNAH